MIKESGKTVKRSGERIWEVLRYLGDIGILALSEMLRRTMVGRGQSNDVEMALPGLAWIPSDSPLAHTGPIPDELRQDPFPGGSVPWSIQEAEKEQGRSRELMIWKVAIAVSWTVTAVAALRSIGML